MGLYKKKGSQYYWMSYRVNGRRHYESTKTGNKKLAEKRYAKRVAEEEDGWSSAEKKILFSEAWGKYMREEGKYKAPGTIMRAEQSAKHFLPQLGHLQLKEITPAILSAYRAKRLEEEVKLSTIVKELQFVRRVFSLSKTDWQFVRQSPFEFFRMPASSEYRVKFLGAGQFESLLSACPVWLRPIVILARYSGMRRGNVLGLTWGQLDLQNRVINLDKTKTGQKITIPLTETPYRLLTDIRRSKVVRLDCPYVFHVDGKPYDPYQVSMAFKRACKRAGIQNFRFHDLRHDFASSLVQRGTDLYLVQHLLGHKDGRMTQRYAHLKIDQLRKAVQVLESGDILVTVGEKEEGPLLQPLDFIWRPQRDSNPCYRLERAMS